MSSKPKLSGNAFSYLRFSSRKQERGDSVRRQTAARDAWLARNPGVTLNTDLTLADLGVSAFRGRHRLDDKAALKQFLTAVESGRVKAGSFLVVEALDRITREDIQKALILVLGLLQAGVWVVQLAPWEQVYTDKSQPHEVMLMIVELMRGHDESQRKSSLIGPRWAEKRKAARASKAVATKRCKAWLEVRDGRFVVKPGADLTIKRVFRMAADGLGTRAIAKRLNAEGVPHFTGGRWHEYYVRSLLRGREVLGEYQPHTRNGDGSRAPEGEPVVGYYPAVVTEAEWLAVKTAKATRDKNKSGRPPRDPDRVNVFAGLLYDARSEGRTGRLNVVSRQGHLVLLPAAHKRTGEPAVSFPLAQFERAVFKELREVRAEDVWGKNGHDDADELSARVARIDARLKALEAQAGDVDTPDDEVPELTAACRRLRGERRELVEQLDRARARAAAPAAAALGEAKGLTETLDGATDKRDARVRLRQALARVLRGVYCVFVRRGLVQLAAVTVVFDGDPFPGEHGEVYPYRSYLIFYRQAHGPSRTPAALWAGSMEHPGGVPWANRFNLSQPDHGMASYLEAYPADFIDKLLASRGR